MGNDYEKIYAFENLYQAHRKARRGKRWKGDVIEYELDMANQFYILQYLLHKRQYKPLSYRQFTIHDPKERHIHALHYRDRIVQHSLCDYVIEPYMEKHLIFDNAAGRKGKGTHFAMDRLSGFFRDYVKKHGTAGYILKFDIHKYYDSMDHDILYRLCKKAFGYDADLLSLLKVIIDSYEGQSGKGIPLGNQTSTWFALYYLDGLDRLIKEKLQVKHYVRYMDDGILLHHDREYLRDCLRQMTDYIEQERRLSFNEKTQIMPMSQGVDFLGFHFYLAETGKVVRRLRASNKKRMKRKLKRFRHAYREGKITQEAVRRSLVSYRGHLSHGHTWRLRNTVNRHLILTKAKGGEQ